MALHVRYMFWYISLPSSAKRQREMTKFKVLWRVGAHAVYINLVPKYFAHIVVLL